MEFTVNTCLSVSSFIDNLAIKEAKDYLVRNYSSVYSISPHISFHISPLPEQKLSQAKQEIDWYINKLHPFEINLCGLAVNLEKRFFYIQVEAKEIYNLHLGLVAILNKYRDNYIREKDAERIQSGDYDEVQIANIRQYGFPRVLEAFNPHITIGNLPNNKKGIDIYSVKEKLELILGTTVNSRQILYDMVAMYHSDAQFQSQMKIFWEKSYHLYPDLINHNSNIR